MMKPSGPVACQQASAARPVFGTNQALTAPARAGHVPPVPGIERIWAQTDGDPRICIAILDGPVDRFHPSLRGADLQLLQGPAPSRTDAGPASRHGTHVASIIFGQHDGPVAGIAPRCRGVVIPIFESVAGATFRSCSQLDLARALTEAVLAGAHVINVSGGQFSPSGTAHPLLTDVVRDCARRGVLIVAAAGNQGCRCLQVPAALDAVLAVGAMNARGEPVSFSNWGGPYTSQGILAPGEHILGAVPEGGVERTSGTSYATAVVSGAVALLASLQVQHGRPPDPHRIRTAILEAARRRRPNASRDHELYLAGPLDLLEAAALLTRSSPTMTEANAVQASDSVINRVSEATSALAETRDQANGQSEQAAPGQAPRPADKPAEKPVGCGCGGSTGGPKLVYALGQLGYDFASEARLDSIVQKMAAQAGLPRANRGLAYDQRRMLAHLDKNPWEAAAIEWTLSVDGTPLYVIRPVGPFAPEVYKELRRFLLEQIEEGVERISVPGMLVGKVPLIGGQSLPAIIPELRGMFSWTTTALAEAVAGPIAADAAELERNGHAQKRDGVRNFLVRVYHEVRNLGLTPQDRALNYVATNAFEMGQIFSQAIRDKMELDKFDVVPSPIGRTGSDCWDVEVSFFYPERQVQTVRKVYRFTVDVSDNVPVTVGTMRSWFAR